jgi:Zn-dependent peptidase ImmA (M78 family)/DNA-binding XRE family transcriptional regulator
MGREPNHEMVTLARESRGLTQTELAKRANVSQGALSRIEHGLLPLSDQQVECLAGALGYPPTFFFRTDSVYGPGTPCLHHRKRQSMPILKLRQIHATVNVLRMATADLLKGVEIDARHKFYELNLDDYGSVEEIAQLVRASWQLPLGPVKNLTHAIESAGGLVISSRFDTDKLDAISQWPGVNQPPFFFINVNVPGDRLRWNLAHELGHIIMHRAPAPNQEDEANLFAGAFLMPAREIKPDLASLDLAKLAELKRYWKVSMQALIMRAHTLGAISDRQKRSFFTRLSQLGYRKREPVAIPREEPTLLRRVIDFHRQEHGYSVTDLSNVATLSETDFRTSYLDESERRTQLRLVT